MSENVIKLASPPTDAPVQEVIDVLREWLKRAELGQIRGICLAAEFGDGSASTHMEAGEASPFALARGERGESPHGVEKNRRR